MSFVRRIRVAAGFVACGALPLASRLDGSMQFAWAMYSRAGEYRIDLLARDSDGRARFGNPTALAVHAAPAAATFLAGSDHWRPGSSLSILRSHIDDLAAFACSEIGSDEVELILRERIVGGPERSTLRRRKCRP